MSYAIQVQNLNKEYGQTVAVDNVSFTVESGELFGLLGPNGAGKTTTLEILEGLRQADSGSIRIGDLDPAQEPKRLRRIIGVQLQASGMPETMTPDEAMAIFCAYRGVAPRTDLLERFGLETKRKTQFHALSTGQQRRLALALAIAHTPQLLFLDEPTAGLDVASRAELHQILRELKAGGTTIILATHDMAEAEALCDRLAILLGGRLVTVGTPLEVTATGAGFTKVSVQTQNGLLKSDERPLPAVSQRLVRDEYVIYFSTDIGPTVQAVIERINDHDDTLLDLRVERPSLEERFLEITS